MEEFLKDKAVIKFLSINLESVVLTNDNIILFQIPYDEPPDNMISATSAQIEISNNGYNFSNSISFDTFNSSCQLKLHNGTLILIVITFLCATILLESEFRYINFKYI